MRLERLGIEDELGRVLGLASAPAAEARALALNLKRTYDTLFALDFALYDAAGLKSKAPHLMQGLFEARVGLRDRIASWRERGLMTHEVQSALRDVFRILRYAGDILGEIAIGNEHDEQPVHRRAFTGRSNNTFVAPAFDTGSNIPFRSGDVLLVRGRAHNSAAIARIGDVDSQFSHVALVYVDQNKGHWAVEALIEEGAVVRPLEVVLDEGLGRAVLYRFRDPVVAARAAQLMHDRVRASLDGWAWKRIPYDFSMRLRGKRRMFCSKLVHLAYREASNGKVNLPTFRTRLDMQNRDFFNRIGVKARETFAPGDIDVDPSFDLVAEWQDYRVTSDLRARDMVMTKFFEWMDRHSYGFEETPLIRMIGLFGRLSAHFSEGIKDAISSVVPKVPWNMSRRCIATIAMLHKSAETLMPGIRALEENSIRMYGRPLHPRDVLSHLERVREVSGGRIGYLVGRA